MENDRVLPPGQETSDSTAEMPDAPPSELQKAAFEAARRCRDSRITRMRAAVVRQQTVAAYAALEAISLDFIGDTAFRDKFVQAKRGLEAALCDFLLDDAYHAKHVDEAFAAVTQEQWGYIATTEWL